MLLTEKQAILTMIVESQNELTKCGLLDKMWQRERLKGNHVQQVEQMMGQNQSKMGRLKETIFNLLDFLKDASDEKPLAKELKKYQDKDS